MSGQAPDTKLIDLSIEEARAQKWRDGQLKYGPVFRTHPLEELDMEFLDAMNYVEEAERQGFVMGNLWNELHSLCKRVRAIYHEGKPR